METAENGKDLFIYIPSIFLPDARAGASGRKWKRPARESGADGRLTQTVCEPSLCETASLNPSLLGLQHSPACSARLSSALLLHY